MTIVRPPESPASSDEPRSIPVSANPPVSAVSRKYASIFTLQIAHDLPAALTATMAPTLFVKQLGMELSMIGVFFLPFVITALKWLWAPIVDNYYNPSLGRRKSWLAPLTFLVAASFLAVSFVEPSLDNLFLIVSLFMVKQVFFATQEVAADAYVVENLEDGERGVGASVVWLGKEFGQIIGFAGLVTVADKLGWQTAFSAAAGLFILFNLPVILRAEQPTSVAAQTQRADLRHFFARSVNWWVMSVVFAVSFAVQMPVAVIGPFLGDKGFTLSQIAVILGVSASIGAIISLSLASQVIKRLGAKRTAVLMLFIAPLASPGFFWLAAQDEASLRAVIIIILLATIFTAPLRMVLYAARIGWTSKNQAGTDITAQQSVWFLGYAAAGGCAGVIASSLGWTGFFAINVLLTFLAMIYFISQHDRIQQRVEALYQ